MLGFSKFCPPNIWDLGGDFAPPPIVGKSGGKAPPTNFELGVPGGVFSTMLLDKSTLRYKIFNRLMAQRDHKIINVAFFGITWCYQNFAFATLVRKVRHVVIGSVIAAVGVMTSLVLIFTSKELKNMCISDDTDAELIKNRNNIIKTLQVHKMKLRKMKQHWKISKPK